MHYRSKISTEDDPIDQKGVETLIKKGYVVDLFIEGTLNIPIKSGSSKKPRLSTTYDEYLLYIKYRNNMRPVYTQRNAHKTFNNVKRAVEWGNNVGVRHISISIDCGDS